MGRRTVFFVLSQIRFMRVFHAQVDSHANLLCSRLESSGGRQGTSYKRHALSTKNTVENLTIHGGPFHTPPLVCLRLIQLVAHWAAGPVGTALRSASRHTSAAPTRSLSKICTRHSYEASCRLGCHTLGPGKSPPTPAASACRCPPQKEAPLNVFKG